MRLKSAFDGQFYPGDREKLIEWVDSYLEDAPPSPGPVLGVVVPHAGYVFSGRAAGRAIGMLRSQPIDAVIVLGPSHRVAFRACRVFDLEGYETPLGALPGDPGLASELAGLLTPGSLSPGFAEHSVEVQLPLLARALPGVAVVQVVLGHMDSEALEELVDALQRVARTRRVAIVASSDLSHYHPRDRARDLDQRFCELLLAGDPDAMREALRAGEVEACGSGPVLALMELARRVGARFEAVEQTDSSEASGDDQQVVGYLSAAALLPEGQG